MGIWNQYENIKMSDYISFIEYTILNYISFDTYLPIIFVTAFNVIYTFSKEAKVIMIYVSLDKQINVFGKIIRICPDINLRISHSSKIKYITIQV